MQDGPAGKGSRAAPLVRYPLDYTFKVMGLAGDDFAAHALALVAGAAGIAPGEEPRVRPSAGGKYLSVSVTIRLVSEEQRRAVYAALHADARVVYYL